MSNNGKFCRHALPRMISVCTEYELRLCVQVHCCVVSISIKPREFVSSFPYPRN
jgi:hypothetical protein